MRKRSCLPQSAQEIRPRCRIGHSDYNPFVGGVDRDAVYFRHQQSDQALPVPLEQLIAAAADAAGCDPDQILDELRDKLSRMDLSVLGQIFQRPERPDRDLNDRSGARHGRIRSAC